MPLRRRSKAEASINEPLLLLGEQFEKPRLYSFLHGEVAVFLASGPHKNGVNEDSALLIPAGPTRGVLAVADGVGGSPEGDKASQGAIKALSESITWGVQHGEPLGECIRRGFDAAQARVLALGGDRATTLAVVEVDEEVLRSYHAGDSEVLVISSRGKLKYHTYPHSPVGDKVKRGEMAEREAMFSPQRHLVSNVIGGDNVVMDMGRDVGVVPRDTVVLATDGLVDNLFREEIIDTVSKGDLLSGAERLISSSFERMAGSTLSEPCKPDDQAVIVFRPLGG